ncbi:MAG: hypothetical protein AseanaTS_11260 [Candidatus Pelagadaptatus aseana]|uniref:response regulator n=1 Tax=Candidatus Pelagadaptatus aseana TaxID=3120508 RepID=UPI0039B15D89
MSKDLIKISLTTMVVLVFLTGVAYALQRYVLLPGFAQLEQREAVKDLQRTIDAIEREVEHVNFLASDWAQRPNIIEFMENRDGQQLNDSFSWQSLESNADINALMILGQDGLRIWGDIYEPEQGGFLDLEDFSAEIIQRYLQIHTTNTSVAGIILTPAGPILVSAHPIAPVRAEQALQGTMIVGRFLDEFQMARLSEQTRVPFITLPLDGTEPTASYAKRLIETPTLIEEVDDQTLHAFTLVEGLQGNPVLLVRAKIQRDIMFTGNQASRVAFYLIVLTLILMALGIALLFARDAIAVRRRNESIKALVDERTGQLREASQQLEIFKILVDTSNQSIGIFDQDCAIVYANPNLLRDWDQQDDLPKVQASSLWTDFYTDRDQAQLTEDILPNLSRQGSWIGELRRPDPQDWAGEKINLENIFVLPNSDNDKVLIANIATDITEQKRIARELLEAKIAAESANNAKSNFLATITHELRTPLNGIIGMAEMAMESASNENQRAIFTTLLQESDVLLTLINQTLDYAKIEAGMMELEQLPFNCAALVEQMANSIALRCAKNKALQINCLVDPRIPEHLIGDENRLRQILANLTGNAVKFTAKGEINLRAELVSDSDSKARVKFHIEDTGIGIPKEKVGRVFERFGQVDDSMNRRYGGTGLGTNIAQELTQLMNGDIGVSSEEGKGSHFWFTAEFNKDQLTPLAEPVIPDLQGHRILIADHNHTNNNYLKTQLADTGAEVCTATDLIAALEQARQQDQPYDIALVCEDLLNDALKNQKPLGLSTMTVIAMAPSDGVDGNPLQQSWQGAAVRSVNKPIHRKALLGYIKDALASDGDTPTVRATQPTATIGKMGEGKTVLLAEDYPTNQVIATARLKAEGFSVILAEDGLQAVEQFSQTRPDLILMDLQMPNMDGYQASEKIRSMEQAGEHTPIIAVSAHTMPGNRDHCLECGMNDYLSKPFRREDLQRIIAKWLATGSPAEPTSETAQESPTMTETGSSSSPMDFEQAVDEFMGERDLVVEVLQQFVATCQNQVATIEASIATGNFDVIAAETHKIKGGAANLIARPLSQVASRIEQTAREGDVTMIPALFKELQNQVARLENFSQQL